MPERFLVDGYNVIYASRELETLMRQDPEAARERLLAGVEGYCAREEKAAEVVFDAGGRPGPAVHERLSEFLSVTYTASGQSADAYIEKLAYKPGAADSTVVVTGDYDQQKIAAGAGMLRMSSREFLIDMEESRRRSVEESRRMARKPWRVTVSRRLSEDARAALERLKNRQ